MRSGKLPSEVFPANKEPLLGVWKLRVQICSWNSLGSFLFPCDGGASTCYCIYCRKYCLLRMSIIWNPSWTHEIQYYSYLPDLASLLFFWLGQKQKNTNFSVLLTIWIKKTELSKDYKREMKRTQSFCGNTGSRWTLCVLCSYTYFSIGIGSSDGIPCLKNSRYSQKFR